MSEKPYKIFVGRPARMDEMSIIVDPDPNAPKAVLLEVDQGACHFNTADRLRAFILDLRREGKEAFGVDIE